MIIITALWTVLKAACFDWPMQAHADPSFMDSDGVSAMHHATAGNMDCVVLLLKHNAPFDLRDTVRYLFATNILIMITIIMGLESVSASEVVIWNLKLIF